MRTHYDNHNDGVRFRLPVALAIYTRNFITITPWQPGYTFNHTAFPISPCVNNAGMTLHVRIATWSPRIPRPLRNGDGLRYFHASRDISVVGVLWTSTSPAHPRTLIATHISILFVTPLAGAHCPYRNSGASAYSTSYRSSNRDWQQERPTGPTVTYNGIY